MASVLLTLVVVFAGACSGPDMSDPKQVVISFFGAMEKDDKAALVRLLDLAELMKSSQDDYAYQTDEPRVFTDPEQVLNDLTGEGETKKTWFGYQRIINAVQIMGESATVEVTFVDKEPSRGYRTFFGLHLKEGKWRIYSFQVYQESP